jgi:multidrug efflux pump
VLTVMPPPVNGLGTIGGFKLFIEDRAGLGYDALFQNRRRAHGRQGYAPATRRRLLHLHRQRPAARCRDRPREGQVQGVPLQNLFETMQVYLGSLYVNDFNLFGRTWQVVAQADSSSATARGHHPLKTRNAARARWCRSARW